MVQQGRGTGGRIGHNAPRRFNPIDKSLDVKMGYNPEVERFREAEYPMLKDTVYLDHAGTTLYAKTLVDRISVDLLGNLYGNPHSFSSASLNTSGRIDKVRLQVLDLFNADHDDYDVVFVANATAGMKLVADLLREGDGFTYAYHRHSHTSLVGVRESAQSYQCFDSLQDLNQQLGRLSYNSAPCRLIAFPAQSNMDGRRLPISWCDTLRKQHTRNQPILTLLDAAALVSTSPLDLSNACSAPDFTVISLYKMFGLPDLGALIIRRESTECLRSRRYFGGGTVDVVITPAVDDVSASEQTSSTHIHKTGPAHARLEDGTLPIHSITAAGHAIDVHKDLFHSLHRISQHCAFLANRLQKGLTALKHWNGSPVCRLYGVNATDRESCGPVIAFNLQDSQGAWISNAEVEKLSTLNNVCVRTGGVCNPGGVSDALDLSRDNLEKQYASGKRCDGENDIFDDRPTGIVRASLGAMSTISDVDRFLHFLFEYFVDTLPVEADVPLESMGTANDALCVQSITIYPIKSCAGFQVPLDQAWSVRPEGLAWDREWCIISSGTNVALSQKRFPRMALLRPSIDLAAGCMRVSLSNADSEDADIEIPLCPPLSSTSGSICTGKSTKVCGDDVQALIYNDPEISAFFSRALGVACHLARVSPGAGRSQGRGSKAVLQHFQMTQTERDTISQADEATDVSLDGRVPILSSNESPLLIISDSSVRELNKAIIERGGEPVNASVFRANIVVSEKYIAGREKSNAAAYAEDRWRQVMIGDQLFDVMGSCRRCQMVCIDQKTGQRSRGEPFLTLAKTRRYDGKVWFGQHARHVPSRKDSQRSDPTIKVGDVVVPTDAQEIFEGSISSDASESSITWLSESSG